MQTLHTPRLDFIVLAYPRSGTTWIANWLTTESSLCLHDPFAMGLPEEWPSDSRLMGISCTTSVLIPTWLNTYKCPIAIIDRDVQACNASLDKLGFPASKLAQKALLLTQGRHFGFDSLWEESSAKELWSYLLPTLPFDSIRWKLLKNMQVQPYWPNWNPNMESVRHIARLISNLKYG